MAVFSLQALAKKKRTLLWGKMVRGHTRRLAGGVGAGSGCDIEQNIKNLNEGILNKFLFRCIILLNEILHNLATTPGPPQAPEPHAPNLPISGCAGCKGSEKYAL